MKRMRAFTFSFTLPELIFSVAVVSLAALALAYSILEVRQTELASQTVFTVVSIDSALAGAIVDAQNYQAETTKEALRSGRWPGDLSFHLILHLPGGDRTIDAKAGETVWFDRRLQPCRTYPIGNCGYKLKLNLETHPPAFSYEVSSVYPEAALTVERRDRNKVIIPKSLYRDLNRIACDPRREVGLSGLFSRDQYDCISKPELSCVRGTLPKGLVVDSKTHSLEFDCGPATSVARCPASYSLFKLNTKSLDAGQAKQAVCVRTTANVAVPEKQPAPALRLAGTACPNGYRSDSSCTLLVTKAKPGRCGTGKVQPVPGRIHFTQNQPVGSVDCGVDLQTQSCGAIWDGVAQLKIKCVLDQPEFANAL